MRWFPFLYLIPQGKGRRFSVPFRGCTSLQPRALQRWDFFMWSLVWHHCYYSLGLTAKLGPLFRERGRKVSLQQVERILKAAGKIPGNAPKSVTFQIHVPGWGCLPPSERAVWYISFCFSKSTYDKELVFWRFPDLGWVSEQCSDFQPHPGKPEPLRSVGKQLRRYKLA